MAVTTGTRSFWSALLSVLLKCIAALRFLPVTRPAAAAPATAAPAPATQRPTAEAGAAPTAVRGARPSPEPHARLPYAPVVPCVPQQSRRRAHTLPPTMKQRISAEAHGSSPSVRSRSGDVLTADGRYAGSVTIASPADVASPDAAPAAAGRAPAPRTSAAQTTAARTGSAPAPRTSAASAAGRVREPALPRA